MASHKEVMRMASGEEIEMVQTQGLQRIVPRQCEAGVCVELAFWAYNGYAVGYDCMRAMAAMNSDNAEAFAPALGCSADEHGSDWMEIV